MIKWGRSTSSDYSDALTGVSSSIILFLLFNRAGRALLSEWKEHLVVHASCVIAFLVTDATNFTLCESPDISWVESLE